MRSSQAGRGETASWGRLALLLEGQAQTELSREGQCKVGRLSVVDAKQRDCSGLLVSFPLVFVFVWVIKFTLQWVVVSLPFVLFPFD